MTPRREVNVGTATRYWVRCKVARDTVLLSASSAVCPFFGSPDPSTSPQPAIQRSVLTVRSTILLLLLTACAPHRVPTLDPQSAFTERDALEQAYRAGYMEASRSTHGSHVVTVASCPLAST